MEEEQNFHAANSGFLLAGIVILAAIFLTSGLAIWLIKTYQGL